MVAAIPFRDGLVLGWVGVQSNIRIGAKSRKARWI
jgi:hypothetical protein